MNGVARLLTTSLIGGVLFFSGPPQNAQAQTTSLKAEYLMTLYGALKQQTVNNGLRVVDVPSGWVDGPRIKGKILPPSADWVRTLASGVTRLDVRLVVQTDDNQIIYVSYNGIQQCPKENVDRLVNGELLKADDCYFIAAPTFETSSERYSWLNAVQAVAKMIEIQRGSHVKYDIFMMR
jgi:hypothetical protein